MSLDTIEDIKPNIHQLSISPPGTPTPTMASQPTLPRPTETYRPPVARDKPPHLPSTSPAAHPKIATLPLRVTPGEGSTSRAPTGIESDVSREMIKTLPWPQPGPLSHPTHFQASSGKAVPQSPHNAPAHPTGSSSTPTSSPRSDRAPRWTTATTTRPAQPSLLSRGPLASSSQPAIRPSKHAPLQRSRTAPHVVPENQTPLISRSSSSSQPVTNRSLLQAMEIRSNEGTTNSPASTYVTAGSQGSRPQPSVSPLALNGQLPVADPTATPSRAFASPQNQVPQTATPILPPAPISNSPLSLGPSQSTSGSTTMILELARKRLQRAIPDSTKIEDVSMSEVGNEGTAGPKNGAAFQAGLGNGTATAVAAESSGAAAGIGSSATTQNLGSGTAVTSTTTEPVHQTQANPSQTSAAQGGQAIVTEIKNALVALGSQLADLKADIASHPTHGDLEQLHHESREKVSGYQNALTAWQVQNDKLSHEYTRKLEELPRLTDLTALEARMMSSLVPRAGFESMRSDLKDQLVGVRAEVGAWRIRSSNEAKAHSAQLGVDRDAQQSDHATLLSRLDRLEKSLSDKTVSAEIKVTLSAHSASLSAINSQLSSLSGQMTGLDKEHTRAQNREALSVALQPILDKQSELATAQETLTTTLDEIRQTIPPRIDIQEEVRKGLQAFFAQFDVPSWYPMKPSSSNTSPPAHLGPIMPKDHSPQCPLNSPVDCPKPLIKTPRLSTFAEDEEDDVPGALEPLFDDSLGPSIADDLPPLSEVSEGCEAGINPNVFKWQHSFHGLGGIDESGEKVESQGSIEAVAKVSEQLGLGGSMNPLEAMAQDWDMGRVRSEAPVGDAARNEGAKAAQFAFDLSQLATVDKPAFPSVQTAHPPTPPPEVLSPTKATGPLTEVSSAMTYSESVGASRKPPRRARSITSRLDPSQSIQPKSIKRSASVLTSDSKDSKLGLVKRRKTGPRAVHDPKQLAKSDGKARGAGNWPKKGPLTDIGLLQTIECDVCHGLAHWTCAGLSDDEVGPAGDWRCPDCTTAIEAKTAPEDIEQAPRDRCIRGSCIRRSNQKIQSDQTGGKAYLVERIIGRMDSRKAVSRNHDGSRNFENLVLWHGYPLDESTWEPDANLGPHRDSLLAAYNAEREAQGLDSKPKVVLLQEATVCFDHHGNKIKR